MRLLLVISLALPLMAEETFPLLTSVDGGKTMHARPVAVEGGLVQFEKKDGRKFKASPDKFSEQDRKQLEVWAAAMKKHRHAGLVKRVKSAKVLQVLFIGNSYSFQIPKVFERLAQAEGQKVKVGQVTHGGWTLQKHAADSKTLGAISNGKWDVVVLQEQSLLPAIPENQRARMMDPAVKKLVGVIRESGAVPALFLTWGRRDGDQQNARVFPDDTFLEMQKRLGAGYRKAADNAGGVCIVPVGEVWQIVREMRKDEGLYTRDGSHPDRRGNYLSACVFYSAMFDEGVKKPARNVEDARVLAEAAGSARLKPLPYPLPAPSSAP